MLWRTYWPPWSTAVQRMAAMARENRPLIPREIQQRKSHNQIIHVDTRYWRISCLCVSGRNWAEQVFNLLHGISESGRYVFWSKKERILLHVPVNHSFRNSADLSLSLNTVLVHTSTSSLTVMCQTCQDRIICEPGRSQSWIMEHQGLPWPLHGVAVSNGSSGSRFAARRCDAALSEFGCGGEWWNFLLGWCWCVPLNLFCYV